LAKYRKKSVIVEAVQYDGTEESLIKIMQLQSRKPNWIRVDAGDLLIPTLEGVMRATVGDYIIKGVKGELYPCKPDVFEKTYEPVGLMEAKGNEHS
jgi:hypothetical protein